MGALSESLLKPLLQNARSTANEQQLRINSSELQLQGPHLQMILLAIFA